MFLGFRLWFCIMATVYGLKHILLPRKVIFVSSKYLFTNANQRDPCHVIITMNVYFLVYKYLCFTHSCLFYYCMDATGDLSWQKGYQDTYQGESLSYRKYKCSLPPSCCFIAWPDSGSVSVPQKTTLEPPVQQKEYLRNFNRSGLFGWQWKTLFKVKIIYCTQYFNKKMFLFQHTCSIRVRSSESTEFKKLWARSRHN